MPHSTRRAIPLSIGNMCQITEDFPWWTPYCEYFEFMIDSIALLMTRNYDIGMQFVDKVLPPLLGDRLHSICHPRLFAYKNNVSTQPNESLHFLLLVDVAACPHMKKILQIFKLFVTNKFFRHWYNTSPKQKIETTHSSKI